MNKKYSRLGVQVVFNTIQYVPMIHWKNIRHKLRQHSPSSHLRSAGAYCLAKPSWEAVAYDHLKGAQVAGCWLVSVRLVAGKRWKCEWNLVVW